MFITYDNGKEVIITSDENEIETVGIWFVNTGRDITDYDRTVANVNALCISSTMKIDG